MTPPLHTCLRPGHQVRLKAGACVPMHTITLCYSHRLSASRVDQVRLAGGFREVWCHPGPCGLPVSNGFMLPVRITRGCLYWAPCVSAPRLSIAWFRTRGRQRRVCACRGCSASTPLSATPWLEMCECWAAACARVRGPGGIVPGYVQVCRAEEKDLRRYRCSSYV